MSHNKFTKFEFVVTSGVFQGTTAAQRGHAVKSGLQRKVSKDSGVRDSQLTIRQKTTLRGRFRVTEKAKRKPTAEQGQLTQSSVKKPQASELDDTNITQDHTSQAEHASAETEITRLTLKIAPNQGRADVFNILPVTQNDGVDSLIKFSTDVQRHWWSYAMYDPLVLHSTLGVASSIWYMYVPRPFEARREGLRQKDLAIRGVQDRLAKYDTSDAVVGTVANLANMEACSSALHEAALLHIKGVVVIAQARGGYATLSSNTHVARAVQWVDLQTAAGLGTRPLLPLIRPVKPVSLPAKILSLAAEEPSLSHLRSYEATQDTTAVQTIFWKLRQAYYTMKLKKELTIDDLRVTLNGAHHSLANLVVDKDQPPQTQVLLHAAMVFVFRVIRENSPECPIPSKLARRLKEQVEAHMSVMTANPEYWHGLLWSLWMGTVSSSISGDVWDFFFTNLKVFARMTGFTYLQLESVFRKFLWDDKLFESLQAMDGLTLGDIIDASEVSSDKAVRKKKGGSPRDPAPVKLQGKEPNKTPKTRNQWSSFTPLK
ncbi:hypothetical protein S40285_09947 [Stachybotrys chlorohalonatus IBT 40285]|uniref:Uncharacterized protein n=1 Tax=Stachybotrys chlorohalonatus (strain IBT 40285) TaxID=1283841 RepID=A0A084QQU3_STAC4|nr:hypothetical protein S40285_09947 [Stachybotrys chlorohalonata IBT 40285]